MIVLSLDEYGDFENMNNKEKSPILVGGISFYDKDIAGEETEERKRIRAYYQAVCANYSTADIKLEYPKSLHGGNKTTSEEERTLKQGVQATIKEFITKGTFKGKKLELDGAVLSDRQGKYYPYLILKSDSGKEIYGQSSSVFSDDQKASNLYYHMVHAVLNRLICQNDIAPDTKKYALHLATRSTQTFYDDKDLFPDDYAKKMQYKEAGYEILEKDANGDRLTTTCNSVPGNVVNAFRVQLTNTVVYRTALSELIIQHQMADKEFDFEVKSIKYDVKKKRNRNDNFEYEFLYLADSICAIFSYRMGNEGANSWLKKIVDRIGDVCDRDNFLLFGYDTIEDIYNQAYQYVMNGDYYQAFCSMYHGDCKEGEFAEYYKTRWFPYLESLMIERMNMHALEKAVMDFERSQRSNAYSVQMSAYVMKGIDRLIQKNMEVNGDREEYNSIYFMFYSALVTQYSHFGDPLNAKKAFEKCDQFSHYASTEELLRVKNKMAENFLDLFERENALKVSLEGLNNQIAFGNLRASLGMALLPENTESLNKTYSQTGRVYSYMRDEKAIEMYKTALEGFKDKSFNYFITEANLLQTYLDLGMKEDYEKMAPDYFDNRTDLESQLDYILEQTMIDGRTRMINPKFALYIYAKGLYLFEKDAIGDSLWDKLCDLRTYAMNKGLSEGDCNWLLRDGYPMELIAKYIIFIGIYRNDTAHLSKGYENSLEFAVEKQGGLLQCIGKFARVEMERAKGNMDGANAIMCELIQQLKSTFAVFDDVAIPDDMNAAWEWLENQFTFMFR